MEHGYFLQVIRIHTQTSKGFNQILIYRAASEVIGASLRGNILWEDGKLYEIFKILKYSSKELYFALVFVRTNFNSLMIQFNLIRDVTVV